MSAQPKLFTTPKIAFIAFMLIVIAILIWLGAWQLQRLTWKQGLVAQVTTRVDLPPKQIPPPADWDQMIPEDFNFTPSLITGTYQFEHEAYVFTTLHTPKGKLGGQGVWVMTPLKLASGHLVYINRGFVPYEVWQDGTQTWDPPMDTLTLTGLLRKVERQDAFAPDPDLITRLFNRRDPAFIARALQMSDADIANLAPFFLDAAVTDDTRLPQAGETVQTFTNNHLSYVVTWFGLALAVLGSLIYWLVLLVRTNRSETPS